MRLFGFSTGALAYADFRRALALVRPFDLPCVELSALRRPELPNLMQSLDDLDLSGFQYISVHAPSQFDPAEEEQVAAELRPALSRGWPVVLHPDTICEPDRWAAFGRLLLIENMDKRKSTGRSVTELREVFPDCLGPAFASTSAMLASAMLR